MVYATMCFNFFLIAFHIFSDSKSKQSETKTCGDGKGKHAQLWCFESK